MRDHQSVIIDTVQELLSRRSTDLVTISLDSDLFRDLEMDSLEVAELSAVLEEEYGTDPYSSGQLARTPGEVLAFYQSLPA